MGRSPLPLDRRDAAGQDQLRMPLVISLKSSFRRHAMVSSIVILTAAAFSLNLAFAQSTERTFPASDKTSVSITGHNGRVTVVATEDEKQIVVQASSTGAQIGSEDL